jgi:hypothetical protein
MPLKTFSPRSSLMKYLGYAVMNLLKSRSYNIHNLTKFISLNDLTAQMIACPLKK